MEIRNGVFFDVLNPDTSKIGITTIAHALSRQARFGGHPFRTISVAEHSYWASIMIDAGMIVSRHEADLIRLQALLHDATEAFLVDVPSPVKRLLPRYYEIEAGLARAIGDKFGVELEKLYFETKTVDARLCLTEKLAFLGPDGLDRPEWAPLSHNYEPHRFTFLPKWLDRLLNPDKRDVPTIHYHWFMWPGRAKRLFIKRYIELAS